MSFLPSSPRSRAGQQWLCAPPFLCFVAALHEPPRTAGAASAPRALLGLLEPHKKPSASSGCCPSLLSSVLCPVWCRVTDASLCSLCLSAAFTREGMPVSTFLCLISPSKPFFPCVLPCCGVVLLLQNPYGRGLLGVNILLFWGGICLRKGKEETLGVDLYPSLIGAGIQESPNFVVKLSKLSIAP